MKKQLLSLFAAVAVSTVFAQTPSPSPSWSISQNAGFTTTSAGIKFLDAVDANVLWVVGYDGAAASRSYNWFSRSTDGGATFTTGTIFSDTNTYVLSNMEAMSGTEAWVCAFQHGGAPYTTINTGGGGVFKTTDGGLNWINMTAAGMLTNTAQSFADFVSFLTPSVGIMVGDPVGGSYEIWKTTSGGATWSQITGIPAPLNSTEFAITNLYCKQGNSNLWFGTNGGRVYRTTDAGSTWNVSNVTASTNTITQLAFSSPLNGIAYASDGTNKLAFNTTDGGATWTAITPLDVNMGFNDIKAVPGTNYYASVDNVAMLISYSNDNGVTWTNWGSTNIPYLTLDFASASVGWAGSFSDQTVATTGGIWKYTGATLTSTNIPPSSAFTIAPAACGPTVTVTPSNNSGGSGTLTYSWTSNPTGAAFSNSSAVTPAINFTANGTYTITLAVGNGTATNVSSQEVMIVTCAAPTASFSVPSISPCNNSTFATTSTVTAGSPAAGFIWTASPSNGVTFLPSAAVSDPTVKATNPGTYTLTLVASNSSGSVQASQTITVNDCRPMSTFTLPTTACRKDTVFAYNQTQTVTGAGNNTYTWTVLPASNVLVSNTSTPYPQSKRLIFTGTSTVVTVYTVTLKSSNSSGTTSIVQTISVSACGSVTTGIAANTLSDLLNIFPNPAHEVVNVVLPSSSNIYTIKLLNVLGAVVYEEKGIKNSTSINVGDKSKGIYFLNVESDKNEKVTRKIVIE